MATVVAEKIIRIDVVASANAQRTIKALADDMKKIETATTSMKNSMAGGFGQLSGMLTKVAGVLGSLGIATGLGAISRAVLDAATSYQVLEARLGLVLGTQERGAQATAAIVEIAKITGREIDGVSKLYEKAARSAQQFGISEEKVSQITLGFSQAIRLSGASTQEAYAGLVQFGQALASGRFQGDEFRSVMENNSVFMYEFARAAGVSIAALRKMSTEGKLSAQFMFETMTKSGQDGLNMLQRLDKMAQNVPLTFAQSLESMKTTITEFVGETTKLLSFKSDDKLGIFAPLIRSLSELTSKIKELKFESDALGDSTFTKILKWFSTLAAAIPLSPQAALSSALYDAAGGPRNKDKTLAGRLEDDVAAAEKVYNQGKVKLAKAQEEFARVVAGKEGPMAERLAGKRVAGAAAELAETEAAYVKLRQAQSNLRYGERVDSNYGAPPPKAGPSVEEERKAKAAMEALRDFVKAQEEKVAVNTRLLAGETEQKAVLKDLEKLERLLTEAHVRANSALGIKGYQMLSILEKQEDMIDLDKEYKKGLDASIAANDTAAEKLRAQITRDEAAIEALKDKTKATDEYTLAVLKQQQAETLTKLDQFSTSDPRFGQLQQYLILLQQAIDKKNELQEEQSLNRQGKAQDALSLRNDRRIQSLADEINNELKQGITNGKNGQTVGEALLENIRDTFRNQAVDIIVNPITSIMSRKLAELADEFGRYLNKALAEALANQSSDPIGALLSLLPGGTGSSTSTVIIEPAIPLAGGMNFVPYDEFPARLHRGERVLTAQENRSFSGGGGVVVHSNPIINIDSRTDQAVVYAIAVDAVQQGNKALLEELHAQGAM